MKGGATIAEVIPETSDWVKVASEHERQGKLDEAMEAIAKALEANPRDAEALHIKGVITYRRGDIVTAVELMEQSIAISPASKYLRNICEGYRILGRYDEALDAGRKAVKADPRDPICHSNLSVLHYERGEPADAASHARQALALKKDLPGAHLGLAEALLVQGEFEAGWEEYEWRYRLPGVPAPMPLKDIPEWDGKPIKGGLLLVADQGYGDGIQFGRYIPWAAQRCGKVALACSKELQPLLRQLPGIDSVFDAWDAAPKVEAWQTLSGLPRLHGTNLDNIPGDVPYLKADPALAEKWAARLDALAPRGTPRVGLVWAGRPTHLNDRNRSITLSRLAPITEIDGITLISLQKGPATDQIGGYFGRAPLVNLGPEITHFGDSAAVIESLDLVVSVDTSIGHVTGALGRPAWVMLPYAPDWRWLRERSDTPWYPTVRLFRLPAPKAWDAVIATVAAALAAEEWREPVKAKRRAS